MYENIDFNTTYSFVESLWEISFPRWNAFYITMFSNIDFHNIITVIFLFNS